MTRAIKVAHLFPELLNLYADQGNLAVLCQRGARRDVSVEVVPVRLGDPLQLGDFDLLLLGGGSDREQAVVARELFRYADDIKAGIELELPVLAVCGGYQLLGQYYELPDGTRIPGLGAVDVVTKAGPANQRLIGNVAITWDHGSARDHNTVVGFENHGGRTFHDYNALGKVIRGHGNNGVDGKEGIVYKGVIGTYIHGPLLPKNPHVADFLLQRALRYRGHPDHLDDLDDGLEWLAHGTVLRMLSIKTGDQGVTI
ncbi:MAG: glutamine amidotransferase [Firmicutes bacterium]|nr:glutamine amidotransferase [Bacillota bacterium]